MIVKFFLYLKLTGEIILMLPEYPENDSFDNERGNIIFENSLVMGGINWENVEWEFSNEGFLLAQNRKWKYDSVTEDFIDLGLKKVEEND